MKFKSLSIDRTWDDELKGRLKVEGDNGEIHLNVNEAMCQQIMELCAQGLVSAAKEVAEDLRAEVLSLGKEDYKALEDGRQ